MSLDELEKRAKDKNYLNGFVSKTELLQLIALVRLQHEAIHWAQQELIMWDVVEGNGDDLYTDSLCEKALATYEAFEKGEVK